MPQTINSHLSVRTNCYGIVPDPYQTLVQRSDLVRVVYRDVLLCSPKSEKLASSYLICYLKPKINIFSTAASHLASHLAAHSDLLVITFKHQWQTNTAINHALRVCMPANTAMPIFLTCCESKMHIWKIGWEWFALCKNSYFSLKQRCKHTKSDVIRQYLYSKLSSFF